MKHGDTIWACVRPNRKSYLYIDRPEPQLVVSTGFAVLTPREVPASYLYSWVTTDEFVDYLTANATGSAYPAVRGEDFTAADVLLPPPRVLERFDVLAAVVRGRIAQDERESRVLGELRDVLLPGLISGKRCVNALRDEATP